MDSLHEAHLERILENRRRRGVLGTYGTHRESSTATQTKHYDTIDNIKLPPPMKFDSTSPGPCQVPNYTTADEAVPRDTFSPAPPSPPIEAPHAVIAETPPSGQNGFRIDECHRDNGFVHNGNGFSHSVFSSDHRPLRFDEPGSGNSGRGRRWSTHDSRSNWRPQWRKSPTFTEGDAYNARIGRMTSVRRSPRWTVPLITYGKPMAHYPSSMESSDISRRRTLSPCFHRAQPDYKLPFSRRAVSRSGRNTEGLSCEPYGKSSNSLVDEPQNGCESPNIKQRQNRGCDLPHKFPKEFDRQAAGSVIYTAVPERTFSPDFSKFHLPPGVSPPANGLALPAANYQNSTAPNVDTAGLPNARTTMDLRTSVSILAAGDWFYKWNTKGTSVSPRWVWLDTKNHLFLWAHKETYESVFAGTIKLEKFIRVTSYEMQQLRSDGVPETYYVLIVESTRRMLQLGTERHMKANAWYEALNNVMTYLRSHGFGASHTQPMF